MATALQEAMAATVARAAQAIVETANQQRSPIFPKDLSWLWWSEPEVQAAMAAITATVAAAT